MVDVSGRVCLLMAFMHIRFSRFFLDDGLTKLVAACKEHNDLCLEALTFLRVLVRGIGFCIACRCANRCPPYIRFDYLEPRLAGYGR